MHPRHPRIIRDRSGSPETPEVASSPRPIVAELYSKGLIYTQLVHSLSSITEKAPLLRLNKKYSSFAKKKIVKLINDLKIVFRGQGIFR